MFPEPSPNNQALFSSLASGGATPTTLDFHRTAMNAAAANRQYQQNVTSQPQEMSAMGARAPGVGPMEGNDANDAANGLFLLAQSQTRNGPQQTNHYAPAPPMVVHSHPQPVMNMGGNSHEASPNMGNRNNGSISTTSGRGGSEMSDENEQPSRPNTRGKGKRTSTQMSQTNSRKADTPAKGSKKAKGNNGNSMSMAMEPEPHMSEEEQDMTKDEYNANGKKMTDEEKRKNFLERNRCV
jgi:ATF/CREB family transcription factor